MPGGESGRLARGAARSDGQRATERRRDGERANERGGADSGERAVVILCVHAAEGAAAARKRAIALRAVDWLAAAQLPPVFLDPLRRPSRAPTAAGPAPARAANEAAVAAA